MQLRFVSRNSRKVDRVSNAFVSHTGDVTLTFSNALSNVNCSLTTNFCLPAFHCGFFKQLFGICHYGTPFQIVFSNKLSYKNRSFHAVRCFGAETRLMRRSSYARFTVMKCELLLKASFTSAIDEFFVLHYDVEAYSGSSLTLQMKRRADARPEAAMGRR